MARIAITVVTRVVGLPCVASRIIRRVDLGVHRDTFLFFVRALDEVRVIRNAVMHFDPDGLTPEQLMRLNTVWAFVRPLRHSPAQS